MGLKTIVYPVIVLGPVVPHQLSRYGSPIWASSSPRVYRNTTTLIYCSRRRPFCGPISDRNKSHKSHKQNGCRVPQQITTSFQTVFCPIPIFWQMYGCHWEQFPIATKKLTNPFPSEWLLWIPATRCPSRTASMVDPIDHPGRGSYGTFFHEERKWWTSRQAIVLQEVSDATENKWPELKTWHYFQPFAPHLLWLKYNGQR